MSTEDAGVVEFLDTTWLFSAGICAVTGPERWSTKLDADSDVVWPRSPLESATELGNEGAAGCMISGARSPISPCFDVALGVFASGFPWNMLVGSHVSEPLMRSASSKTFRHCALTFFFSLGGANFKALTRSSAIAIVEVRASFFVAAFCSCDRRS
jgi:hypothetical protein